MKKPQEILTQAREKAGLTQTELGIRVGLGLRAIQKIESGIFPKFKKDSIQKIDNVLNTNLHELIYEQKGRVNNRVNEDIVQVEKGTEEDRLALTASQLAVKNYVCKFIAKMENREVLQVLKEIEAEESLMLQMLLKQKH